MSSFGSVTYWIRQLQACDQAAFQKLWAHIPQMDRGFRHEICAKPWESQRFCPFPAETTEEPNG
jgi:hypothetical protein